MTNRQTYTEYCETMQTAGFVPTDRTSWQHWETRIHGGYQTDHDEAAATNLHLLKLALLWQSLPDLTPAVCEVVLADFEWPGSFRQWLYNHDLTFDQAAMIVIESANHQRVDSQWGGEDYDLQTLTRFGSLYGRGY